MSKPQLTRYVPQLPDGWVKCPRFGDPRLFEGLNIIPCKVPLSRRFDSQVGPSGRWTLADAIRQFRGYGMEVGTVIDLTKSRNYYDFRQEMEELGYGSRGRECPINFVKIECRGRGEAPQPSEVNEAVWHIFVHHSDPELASKYVLLHCTHGFNRTGFVCVSALMRLRKDRGINVRRALQRFAECRPPGIYKDHYIKDLFAYYHEGRDSRVVTPRVPAWKGNDDAEDAADAANEDASAEGDPSAPPPEKPPLSHEDIWSIGERVAPAEADFIQEQMCRLMPMGGGGRPGAPKRFPGMQPVSLALGELQKLMQHRYHVTWKADGTRYMMMILKQGTYVMDRSFNVVRCEMRFPCGQRRPPPGQKAQYPVGRPHDLTVLDGEMVVDHDPEGKQPPRLRYLIYDCCMINAIPLLDKPWKERYRAVDSDIVRPRNLERQYIEEWRAKPWDPNRAEFLSPPLNYNYASEPFSVRQKPFWPVWQIDKVFARFGDPGVLGHESDGVILQGYEHPYTAGTCDLLYKWKFAHMNSVDFLLRCETRPGPDGAPVLDEQGSGPDGPLTLFLLDQQATRGSNIRLIPLKNCDRQGHFHVEFPPGVDPLSYDGKLCECTFDRERGVWLFMRERKDKDTPNGSKVYHRIKESIVNHVDQELLVGTLKQALLYSDCYASDRGPLTGQQQATLRQEVESWRARMQAREEEQQQRHWAAAHGHPAEGEGGEGANGDAGPHGHAEGGEYGGYGDGEGYRVSDAVDDPGPGAEPGASRKRLRDSGEGGGGGEEGGGEGGAEGAGGPTGWRCTVWGPEVEEETEHCPAYEGHGFD
ncbi:hypothetical protein HYH03_015311 [Edaphochlamys debaryana]|uniref:mRNA guanylyltransferase n=1 Tax=Edaphochlamys debaryana TaxID=47281 RepID=A0A835XKX5_9CHLO|nr:hypothetical protein HYH03_015311 [Edaphochlamys debaryana]|eukprot:KAG2485988.1 hypothetical protein HYH03_015311 [Edaphochlamys debaryana]